METIEKRLARLEAIEEIKQLKSRYFHACDIKNVDEVRDCFSDGKVLIDYGKIGSFQSRDDFLKVFEEKACHDYILDQHHGHNAQVTLETESRAKGVWDLSFHQINTKTNIMTQLGGYYHDRFVIEESRWVITETVFTVTSTLVTRLEESHYQLVFAGRP